MDSLFVLRLETSSFMLTRIWRKIIHGTVYFKRAQGWVGMATFVMVLRLTLIEMGLDLTWWQGTLALFGVVAAMVLWGWLEFRLRSVDIEQDLWANHNSIMRRLDEQARRGDP